MRYILLVFIFALVSSLKSQEYQVETFYDDYVELVDYNSVLAETGGPTTWEKRFELNFDFPYYNNTYDHINCFYEGVCNFDGDNGIYTMDLVLFGYETDRFRDPNNITSDVRYTLTEKEEKKCLVVQLTKLRMISDPSIEEFDSHIDMQYWFYEDGTIEIRFGHSNLDNSPVYVPGDGFYLISGNQDPVPLLVSVALTDPIDRNKFISYGDLESHERYEISNNELLGILWWPPEGWVIRFSRTGVDNEEVVAQDQWRVYTQNEQIVLDRTEAAISVSADFRLYNSLGQPVLQDELSQGNLQYIDAKNLTQGIYFYELTSDEGAYQSGRLFVEE